MTTVIQIIEAHLIEHGYDGLALPGECGCKLGNLAPCCGDMSQCQPAYRGADPEQPGEWAMYASKEAAEASKRGDA